MPVIRTDTSFTLFHSSHVKADMNFLASSGQYSWINVKNPVVGLDGDDMTRIIWKKIREEVRASPLSLECTDGH